MTIKDRAKKVYKRIWCWNNKVLKPKPLFHVPSYIRVKYAIKGFNANEYVWYDLAHNDYNEYISEYERILSREINGEYKLLLDDKLLFEELFRKYIHVPIIYAWINNGIVYGLHEMDINNSNIIDFFKDKIDLVVKWKVGFEGKGTYIVHYSGNQEFVVNGKVVGSNQLKDICFNHGSAIICEYMIQSSFEKQLYPDATNTLRIICAKKKGEKEVRILRAVQRIGTSESKPVDNVSAGAMAAPIDIATGELGLAVIAKSHNKEELFRKYERHPNTGEIIAGKVIPDWENIKNTILNMTNQFPYLNFVAWDVLLTEDGICLIEGNASAGLMMFQCEHGVRNSDIGEIYRSYGIIK